MPELYPIQARYPGDGNLHIIFVDVGQGCLAYITCPNGKRVLADCGSTTLDGLDILDVVNELPYAQPYQIGRAAIQNFLYVDLIVLSHGDADHYNKLGDIVGRSPIQQIYHGGNLRQDYSMPGFRKWWRVNNLETRMVAGRAVERVDAIYVNQDQPLPVMLCDGTQAGGAACEIWAIASNVPPQAGQSQKNTNSLVIKIIFGNTSAIISGDATAGTEAFMVGNQANMPLRTDLLLVPHHGSTTSSTQAFVDATLPQYAIISERQQNGDNLPKLSVVNRYVTPIMLDEPMIMENEEEHDIATYDDVGNFGGNNAYHPIQTAKEIWQTGCNGSKTYRLDGNTVTRV